MAVIRKGTVARPGVHRRLDGTEEVVTIRELKEAAWFQDRIPLVLKHPETGYINPADRIGSVRQFWNEEEQKMDGEYWFFEEDEYWGKIPARLQTLILDDSQPIKTMSGGFRVPKEWDGDYKPRHWDHIAIDVENPQQNIGIEEGNIRMEELPETFRIEETPEIAGKPKETPSEPEEATSPILQLGITIGELKAENKVLRERLDAIVEQIAPKEEKEEPKAQEEATEPAPPKPKVVIPKGAAKAAKETDDDGMIRFTMGQE